MNRRQFLRAGALAGVVTVGTTVVGSAGASGDDDGGSPPRETPNGTGTPTGTPTPTPTEAVATPTSDWEPSGSVAVPGATETVLAPDGETAFVAVGDGFAVLDLSDPTEPTVLTRETGISPPGTDRELVQAFDVKHDDGELLLAGPASYHPDSFRGVVRYDVTDPGAPELVDAVETTYPVHNCCFADGLAYLTGNDDDRNPLVVVDLAGGGEVGRWSVLDGDDRWADVDQAVRRLHDVWVQDDLAYLAYWDAGTWIVDVSDPADPTAVAGITPIDPDTFEGKSYLERYRETKEPPGNVHYVATDPAGELLAVGKETWNSNAGLEGTTPGPDDPGGPSGIDLYDVSDPTEPTELATIEPPATADPNVGGVWTTAHNFEVGERYLYSSWYEGGVKVHDLGDPTNPREVRYFRRSSTTSFWTAQLTSPGGSVVASSRYNPADLDAPAVVYTFPDVPRETPTATPADTERPPTSAPATADTETQSGNEPTGTRPGDEPAGTLPGDGTTGGDGPGFGPLAALAGLGVGAWRLLGGGDDEQ